MKVNTNKKLWIVSELFFPEETSTAYIMTQIAEGLAKEMNVSVICGNSSYQSSTNQSFAEQKYTPKFDIYRVKSFLLNKDKILQRILRFIIISFKLTYRLLVKSHKGDDVLIVTNPAPLVLLIVLVCKIKRMKSYIVVHDVFPENVVAAGLMNSRGLVYSSLKYLFDNAYSMMTALFVLGRDMSIVYEKKLLGFSKRPIIRVAENWGELDKIFPVEKDKNKIILDLELQEKIIFQFAGNFGRVQGLLELLEIISNINNPILHFIFIGTGALKKDMLEIVLVNKLTNVTFLDTLPRSAQNEFLNACDIGIVSLQEGMEGLGVPSKSYNILSAGKPILFIGPLESEISLMINENKVGWSFQNRDINGLSDFFNSISIDYYPIIKAKGALARSLVQSKYSKDLIIEKYIEVIKNG